MQQFDPKLAGFLLSFLTSVVGWSLLWLTRKEKDTEKKIISAEKALDDKRDFRHLVNNQLEISRGVATGFNDLEHQIREVDNQVREVKAYMIRNTKAADKVE